MSEFRYELKYELNQIQYREVLLFLKQQSIQKKYADRKVNSLYFEKLDFLSVKENISGQSNRKKIRLRWYNTQNKKPQLEVKIRNGRLGKKTIYELENLSLKDLEFLNAKEISKKVFNEINDKKTNRFFENNFLFPILKVDYDREYYELKNNVRITIDSNINFTYINLSSPLSFNSKMLYNKLIMEIKFSPESKKDAHGIIKKINLSPSRHSKYLIGISKLVLVKYF